MSTTQIDYPFQFDGRFRTASTSYEDHVRDLIEQVLMTEPGERVNRPDFGSGLKQLVFAPSNPEVLVPALQFTIRAALQQWLGDIIEVQQLEVTAVESTITVDLKYALRRTGEERTDQFVRPA